MSDYETETRKKLEAWATFRGELKINRFVREGHAVLWEGALWLHNEADRKQLIDIIERSVLVVSDAVLVDPKTE